MTWGILFVLLIRADRPTRLLVWFSRLCYNFVLTSVPLSERPFLYDIMSGSLKTAFNNGCLSASSSLGFKVIPLKLFNYQTCFETWHI